MAVSKEHLMNLQHLPPFNVERYRSVKAIACFIGERIDYMSMHMLIWHFNTLVYIEACSFTTLISYLAADMALDCCRWDQPFVFGGCLLQLSLLYVLYIGIERKDLRQLKVSTASFAARVCSLAVMIVFAAMAEILRAINPAWRVTIVLSLPVVLVLFVLFIIYLASLGTIYIYYVYCVEIHQRSKYDDNRREVATPTTIKPEITVTTIYSLLPDLSHRLVAAAV